MAVTDPSEKRLLLDRKELSLDESVLDELSAAKGFDVPARYILTVLNFLALFTMYSLRTCPNVAMVAMVNATALAFNDNDDNTTVSQACPDTSQPDDVTGADRQDGEFLWDSRTQGLILGAFYYSYTPCQLPVGWLADRVSAKLLMGVGLLLSSLLNLLIPTAASFGPPFFITVRLLQGLAESSVYPAMNVVSSKWIPLQERNKLMSFVYAGSEMGVVCGMLLTGLLSEYGFAGGWPSAFYVLGMMGCVWFLLWMTLVYDSPAEHPRISDRERRFVHSSLGKGGKVSEPVPWRCVLTSGAVWAACVAIFAYNWGYYSMFTSFPTYMKIILHFDIVTNGFLSSLPYLLMWPAQVLGGAASDYMRRYCTITTIRKVMHTLGCLLPLCFIVATSYVECDQTLAVVLVTIGITGKSLAASVVLINTLDFAPRFAGVLFGLCNIFGSIPGFTAPSVIGAMTYQNQSIEQWRKFFFLTAGIYLSSCLIFLGLGSGDVQPWASLPPTTTSIPSPPPSKRGRQEGRRNIAVKTNLARGKRETESLLPEYRRN